MSAIAEQLVQRGRSMMFSPCSSLVQKRLIAEQALRFPRLIEHFSGVDGLIIDDLGYVQQSRKEMELLFSY